MTDEPNKPSEDIEGILSDLDDILSGLGESVSAAEPSKAAVPPPAPVEPPKPVEIPKPAEPPKPVEIPKAVVPPPPAEPPKPVEIPKPIEPPKPIELNKVVLPPPPAEPPKAVEPPKPVEAPKPVELPKPAEPPKAVVPPPPPPPAEPPKPVEVSKPAAAQAEAAKPSSVPPPPAPQGEVPANAAKEQIRRVAYVYTAQCAEARATFASFLSQAARTISKKPLYLRQVLVLELGPSTDPLAVFEKARESKAVAILAVADGWPAAKTDALSEACSRGGLMFMAVPSSEVQKKSTAVDVIVDMMLLAGEA